MAARGRALLAWSLWWLTLFWWWMLIAGEWNHEEWIAGAAAAALGATVAEACRRRAELSIAPPLELRKLPAALAMVVVDFGVLCGALAVALVRLSPPRGRFIHRGASFDAGGLDAASVTRRALTILIAGYSPNAYVVDVERRRNRVLVHDLVPARKSEEPA